MQRVHARLRLIVDPFNLFGVEVVAFRDAILRIDGREFVQLLAAIRICHYGVIVNRNQIVEATRLKRFNRSLKLPRRRVRAQVWKMPADVVF